MSNNPRLEIVMGDHLPRYSIDYRVTPRQYELQYVEEGGVLLSYNQQTFRLYAHTAWINCPGIEYHYCPLPEFGYWNHRYAVLQGTVLSRYKQLGLISRLPWHGDFSKDFDTLLRLSYDDSPMTEFRAVHALENILIASLKNQKEEFPLSEILLKLDKNIPLAQIAEDCHLSLSTFFRKFRKIMNCTAHQYYLMQQIKKARFYLAHTVLPQKKIADMLHFSDLAHFHRLYRKYTGETPGMTRKAAAAAEEKTENPAGRQNYS